MSAHEPIICTFFNPVDPANSLMLVPPCRRRNGEAVPRAANFGDLITADHKVLSDNCESRNNHRYAVVVQDLASQWIQAYPCKNKTSQETQRSKSSWNPSRASGSQLTVPWRFLFLCVLNSPVIAHAKVMEVSSTRQGDEKRPEAGSWKREETIHVNSTPQFARDTRKHFRVWFKRSSRFAARTVLCHFARWSPSQTHFMSHAQCTWLDRILLPLPHCTPSSLCPPERSIRHDPQHGVQFGRFAEQCSMTVYEPNDSVEDSSTEVTTVLSLPRRGSIGSTYNSGEDIATTPALSEVDGGPNLGLLASPLLTVKFITPSRPVQGDLLAMCSHKRKSSLDTKCFQESHSEREREQGFCIVHRETHDFHQWQADQASQGEQAALTKISEVEYHTRLPPEEQKKPLSEARSETNLQESRVESADRALRESRPQVCSDTVTTPQPLGLSGPMALCHLMTNRNTRHRLDTFSSPEDEHVRSAVLLPHWGYELDQ